MGTDAVTIIRGELAYAADDAYRKFQCGLIPTVSPDRVLGVRMPCLRSLAADLMKCDPDGAAEFLSDLPHRFYDEDNLHGCLISLMKDFSSAAEALDSFLPFVDNWATCDMINPKAFKKRPPELLPRVRRWISSGRVYTVRFGICVLMRHYLDEGFSPDLPELVRTAEPDEYYVNMAKAWYFATALVKQRDAAMPYLKERKLSPWVHNKTIQKAVESFRIDEKEKSLLSSMRMSQRDIGLI